MPHRFLCLLAIGAGIAAGSPLAAAMAQDVRTGEAAYSAWRSDAPGVWRHLRVADMPAPHATPSAGNPPRVIARPGDAHLRAPPGFTVEAFATGLANPRMVRVAPGGAIFVTESRAGQVRLLHAPDGASHPTVNQFFASGLDRPFGIAFWPPGPQPRFVYVAEVNRILRFPWHPGTTRPDGPPQVVVVQIAPSSAGHWTRDIAFSPDGRRMYVAVGSISNDSGPEPGRALVLSFDPEGHGRQEFATGLRNCVSLAIAPGSGTPWCAVNERDGLGDNLPPDYVTHLQEGGFYGWPWFYIGDHPDPRHRGQHPELGARTIVPDVLIQPHSAPLGMTFYEGRGPAAFPAEYRGDIFVALHGSWNRTPRTGYKLIRIRPRDGACEDFVTGFVASDRTVWGRPVAVAVAHDGALLMTDDGGNTIWRIAHAASR